MAQPLTARDREIAEAHRPACWRARGLLLVGLDVIGDCLTEINVTSPTCFQEITQQSGFDVAKMFIDALESGARWRAERPSRRRGDDARLGDNRAPWLSFPFPTPTSPTATSPCSTAPASRSKPANASA